MVLGIFRSRREKKHEELKSAFEQYLREKYREEFMIEEISKINYISGIRYRATFTPVKNPAIKSELTAKDAEMIAGDNYMNDFFSWKQDSFLGELLEPVFQEKLVVFSFLWPILEEEGWPPAVFNDTTMSLDEYLNANIKDLENTINFFVKSETDINIDQEAERINQVADILYELGFMYQNLHVFYLNPGGFKKIGEKRSQKYEWEDDDDLFDFIHENCWAMGSIYVHMGEKDVCYTDDIIEVIKHSFKEYRKIKSMED